MSTSPASGSATRATFFGLNGCENGLVLCFTVLELDTTLAAG